MNHRPPVVSVRSTALLMRASAAFLVILGALASFAPQEILVQLGAAPQRPIVLLVQLLGAQSLGLAALNWTARGNLIGGIYSRAVAIANVIHFSIAALTFAKAVLAGPRSLILVAATMIYAVLAVSFARVLVTHPIRDGTT
jgi:hypothetical protein